MRRPAIRSTAHDPILSYPTYQPPIQDVSLQISVPNCVPLRGYTTKEHSDPDSKIHGANMGPTWVLSAPGGPRVGPRNLAIRGGRTNGLAHLSRGYLFTCTYVLCQAAPNFVIEISPWTMLPLHNYAHGTSLRLFWHEWEFVAIHQFWANGVWVWGQNV